jgi:hypothetical protein
MTHAEFLAHYRAGDIRADFDRALAAKYLSARLMLPFFMLPVLGAGVALALMGWLWTGLAIIALGIIAPRLIKRSAPHFLITQALEDESVFNELIRAGVLRLTAVTADTLENAT